MTDWIRALIDDDGTVASRNALAQLEELEADRQKLLVITSGQPVDPKTEWDDGYNCAVSGSAYVLGQARTEVAGLKKRIASLELEVKALQDGYGLDH